MHLTATCKLYGESHYLSQALRNSYVSVSQVPIRHRLGPWGKSPNQLFRHSEIATCMLMLLPHRDLSLPELSAQWDAQGSAIIQPSRTSNGQNR